MHLEDEVLVFLVDPIVGDDLADKLAHQPRRIGVGIADAQGRVRVVGVWIGHHWSSVIGRASSLERLTGGTFAEARGSSARQRPCKSASPIGKAAVCVNFGTAAIKRKSWGPGPPPIYRREASDLSCDSR